MSGPRPAGASNGRPSDRYWPRREKYPAAIPGGCAGRYCRQSADRSRSGHRGRRRAITSRRQFRHRHGQDAASVVQIGADRVPLLVPMRLFGRRSQQDRKTFVVLAVAHYFGPSRLVRRVVHACLVVDDRFERGVDRHVLNALAVDSYLASVAQHSPIFFSGSDHARPLPICPGSTVAATDGFMKGRNPPADHASIQDEMCIRVGAQNIVQM